MKGKGAPFEAVEGSGALIRRTSDLSDARLLPYSSASRQEKLRAGPTWPGDQSA
jgi:hypothetical protein